MCTTPRFVPGPRSRALAERSAAALADAGWEIEEIELPELDLIKELWGQVLSFDVAAALPVFQLVMGEAELELLGALVAGAAEFERPASAAFSSGVGWMDCPG